MTTSSLSLECLICLIYALVHIQSESLSILLQCSILEGNSSTIYFDPGLLSIFLLTVARAKEEQELIAICFRQLAVSTALPIPGLTV